MQVHARIARARVPGRGPRAARLVHRSRRAVRALAHRTGAVRHRHEVTLERLFPERERVTVEQAYGSLGLLERARPDRPYVVANMVTTADGRATLRGQTEDISNDTDRDLFHMLRGQVDAVMVGTATIALERYGPLARRPEVRSRRAELGLPEQPLACTA